MKEKVNLRQVAAMWRELLSEPIAGRKLGLPLLLLITNIIEIKLSDRTTILLQLIAVHKNEGPGGWFLVRESRA